MVKGYFMLISEFSQRTGLPVDTIRFYVRKGLIQPKLGTKGGSNPYQIFTEENVEAAKIIRVSQALGFPLKHIGAGIADYMKGNMSSEAALATVREQLARMEAKAAEVAAVVEYMRAKLTWMEDGSKGPGPNFDDYVSPADVRRRSSPKD
jgi:MerR family copper efflux transcriptional regulator